ncbi:MAG: response regulator [Phenylobacterium sp.]|uniref:response regulator n=1 Tax=Phenylobacterium sp. TaxID=1871053 RepID=UPI0017FDEFF1|nr:response regulator [Phenylobacterium sp.]MBA4792231.1 response regulator [Phenylobacterium sp.]
MTAASDSRPILLLVDDEPDILVALEDLFEDDYRVVAARSGREGLQRLTELREVAVILSDQRMPEMTGDAFLAQAREISDAQAILLTGYADLSSVTSALNRGGIVGYAAKPWEPDGLRAMVATAAEQHRLKRALHQERALLRGLMAHLPAAVAVKDADGRFVRINERKAETLGLPPEASLGRTEPELGGRGRPDAEQMAVNERRTVEVLDERQTETGPQWLETSVVPVPDADGEIGHLVVLERDVTDEKLAEMHLRQSDKLRALGTLAGGVAHDFNNLLTAIIGSLELAARRLGDERAVRRYLDNATLAAQKGAGLTQRLLGFSRQTESRGAEVTDLGALLLETRDLVERTLGASVRTLWDVAPGLWPAAIEPDQFELALLNLTVNARDAMPDGGDILVTAENLSLEEPPAGLDLAPGDYVRVSVRDSGEGMSPEVLARVLEPFFTTKPVGKGTGLGLPMAYGFAQRSGGALEICSELGQGADIRIYLPRAAVKPGESAVPAAAEGAASPARGDRRVLVVDDEAAVRSVTAGFLRDCGYDVVEADSAATALDLIARDEPVDLALVDFAMPGLNGVEFARQARPLRPNLPIILLTGYFDVEVPNDVALVHKPFSNATLQAAIAEAWAASAPADA